MMVSVALRRLHLTSGLVSKLSQVGGLKRGWLPKPQGAVISCSV